MPIYNQQYNRAHWLCRCDCRKETIVLSYNLKSGHTQSCGCLQKELSAFRSTVHGHNRVGKESAEHRTWRSMIQRCINPKNKNYHNYGGRKITVCERWVKFENFLADMGKVPIGLQLDRSNNDKGYFKENCCWSTPKEQQRNKRNNHLETYGEKTQCVAVWAEEYNISYDTLLHRLRRGWSIEKALMTPICGVKDICYDSN